MLDYIVYIGRFQPFHNNHKRVLDYALTKAKKVIILIGSSFEAPSLTNPLSYEVRRDIIKSDTEHSENIKIRSIKDYPYDDIKWAVQVRRQVSQLSSIGWTDYPPKIGIIGNRKDHSAKHLEMFPEWEYIECHENDGDFHATDIRRDYFINSRSKLIEDPRLSPESLRQLIDFRETDAYKELINENVAIVSYQNDYKNLPFPPIFQTVDCLVRLHDQILLVKRKGPIGKGKWALPGGFLNADERLADGAIRELQEETGIVPLCIPTSVEFFHHTKRSKIGRVFTAVFYFNVDNGLKGVLKAADDAERVAWFPIDSIKRDMMHDDHYHIIHIMLGNEYD